MNEHDKIEDLIRESREIESRLDLSSHIINRFHSEREARSRSRQTRVSFASSGFSVVLLILLFYSIPELTDGSRSSSVTNEYSYTTHGFSVGTGDMLVSDADEQQMAEKFEEEVANHIISDSDIAGIIRDYDIDETELLSQIEISEDEFPLNY